MVRFQMKGMNYNIGEHNFLTKTQVINAADPIFHFISTNAANFNDVKSIFQNGNYGEYYKDAISLLMEIGFIKNAKNKSGQDIYKIPEGVKLHLKGKRFTSFYGPKKLEAIKHQFVELLKKNKGNVLYNQYINHFSAFGFDDQETFHHKDVLVNEGVLVDSFTKEKVPGVSLVGYEPSIKKVKSKIKEHITLQKIGIIVTIVGGIVLIITRCSN